MVRLVNPLAWSRSLAEKRESAEYDVQIARLWGADSIVNFICFEWSTESSNSQRSGGSVRFYMNDAVALDGALDENIVDRKWLCTAAPLAATSDNCLSLVQISR